MHKLHHSGLNYQKVEAEAGKLHQGLPLYTIEEKNANRYSTWKIIIFFTNYLKAVTNMKNQRCLSSCNLTNSFSAETEPIDFFEPSNLGSRSLNGSDAVENETDSSLDNG